MTTVLYVLGAIIAFGIAELCIIIVPIWVSALLYDIMLKFRRKLYKGVYVTQRIFRSLPKEYNWIVWNYASLSAYKNKPSYEDICEISNNKNNEREEILRVSDFPSIGQGLGQGFVFKKLFVKENE